MQNGTAGDLYDAVAAIVAVNQHPGVHNFLEEMVGINHVISSCDEKFPLIVKSKSFLEYTITFNKTDFAFAEENVQKIPIWPIIVAKAAAAFHQKNGTEVIEGAYDARLKDADDEVYKCNEKGLYLCDISYLVSRLTGVKLKSTPRIIKSEVKWQETFDNIFAQSKRGPTIVFEHFTPKYLIEYDDVKENENKKDYNQKTFHARKLDIHKRGKSHEMNYELKSISGSEIFKYEEIIDGDGASRGINVVYPL